MYVPLESNGADYPVDSADLCPTEIAFGVIDGFIGRPEGYCTGRGHDRSRHGGSPFAFKIGA